MSEAAVAEPEVSAETETEELTSTEGQDVTSEATEDQASAQTESAPEPESDPEETARLEAIREAAAEETRQKLIDEGWVAPEQRAQQATEQQRASATASFREAIRAQTALLDSIVIHDAEGNRVFLSEADKQTLLGPWAKHNLNVLNGALADADAAIEAVAAKRVPSELSESFFAAANGKSREAFIEALIEHAALGTRAVKNMGLDDAIKASPKLKRELLEHDQVREKTLRQKWLKEPPGEPGGSETGAPGRRLTLAQIDAMPTSEWMAYPKEQRDRMLEEARS